MASWTEYFEDLRNTQHLNEEREEDKKMIQIIH